MEKKILAVITICFFLVMITFTFVSRHTATSLLPKVSTTRMAEDGSLPKSVLRTDENGGSYILFVIEEDSILGKVSAVVKQPVQVDRVKIDKVMIKDIRQYSTFEIVRKSSDEVVDGDRVRCE